jgi:hypothetical protein
MVAHWLRLGTPHLKMKVDAELTDHNILELQLQFNLLQNEYQRPPTYITTSSP